MMKSIIKLLFAAGFFLTPCLVYGQRQITENPYTNLLQIKSDKDFNVSYSEIIKKLFETEKDPEKRIVKMNMLNEVRNSYLRKIKIAALATPETDKNIARHLAVTMRQRYALTEEQEDKLIKIIEVNRSIRIELVKSSQDSIFKKNSLQNIREDYEKQLSILLQPKQYENYRRDMQQAKVRVQKARHERNKNEIKKRD